jgi:hypothetical protein
MDECNIEWDLNLKPYVWVKDDHGTDLGREIATLGEIERRELAFQLMSVMGRGESTVLINGNRFSLFPETFYNLDA